MNRRVQRILLACALLIVIVFAALLASEPKPIGAAAHGDEGGRRGKLDPAGWGADHVGKPLPEFVSGDECLFCHRNNIAPTWKMNRHQLTIRPAETDPAALAALKGSSSTRDVSQRSRIRDGREELRALLKRTNRYGQFATLSTAWRPAADARAAALIDPQSPHWDTRYLASCAGCHTTAVDPKTQSFSAVSLDCFACHGDVRLEHSKNTTQVILSKRRRDPAQRRRVDLRPVPHSVGKIPQHRFALCEHLCRGRQPLPRSGR